MSCALARPRVFAFAGPPLPAASTADSFASSPDPANGPAALPASARTPRGSTPNHAREGGKSEGMVPVAEADEAEHEARAEESGGDKAKAKADAQKGAVAKPAPVVQRDANAEALKNVRASLRKAYAERRALTSQLTSILNGLAGLETNAEKRKKLLAEARQKLPAQAAAAEKKERELR